MGSEMGKKEFIFYLLTTMMIYLFFLCVLADLAGNSQNPASSAVSEKVRTRLEELDDLEEVINVFHMSEVICIDHLHGSLLSIEDQYMQYT